MIASKFFEFYKKSSSILKLLLSVLLPLMAILWIIGSLTYIDRLLMFIVGLITGCILVYIFYPDIYPFINNLIEGLKQLIGVQ